ncbi:MAG: AMP-binding protein [Rhizobium sp.]|nr:AMP-binding protein [Rhizobium sp.]
MRNDPHLAPRAANYQPLTPLDFLDRTVNAFPDRPAVVWRDRQWTYSGLNAIVMRMARFLIGEGVAPGDVVSVMCANRPEMLAAHFAVPMVGAVLNPINIRLDQSSVGYILGHAESRMILADDQSAPVASAAAAEAGVEFYAFAEDGLGGGVALLTDSPAEAIDYRAFVTDEWQGLCLNYTSGTTGNPKGVVYHHRGAYLNALGNVLALGLDRTSVYLWTLPMFHCDGWCHPWAVTAAGGLHVCLDRVDPALIFSAIGAERVTHMSCAPVVLYMLLNHPSRAGRDPGKRITVATGGAAPTSALIAEMDALGFDLIHLYGLTESYGPATLRILDETEARSSASERAELLACQGKRHVTANRVRVVDETGADVAADGQSIGEILLKGNTLMAGYYRDPDATDRAFEGGQFHTGDLAVVHPDGQIEIRDRSKDVIISGGENISSLEIESVLARHPSVLMSAAVALADPKWGEIPCVFIELKAGCDPDVEDLTRFCRQHLPGFKIPRRFFFRELPKTATGKIQKYLLREMARAEAAGP